MENENILVSQELSNKENSVGEVQKPETKSKKSSKTLDMLEKVREEERAKLEALKLREQEKTRLAIEKERARLEAELAKEIRELEKQLDRAKSASSKIKSQIPPTIDLSKILTEETNFESIPDENIDVDTVAFVEEETEKPKTKKAKKAQTKSKATKIDEKIKKAAKTKKIEKVKENTLEKEEKEIETIQESFEAIKAEELKEVGIEKNSLELGEIEQIQDETNIQTLKMENSEENNNEETFSKDEVLNLQVENESSIENETLSLKQAEVKTKDGEIINQTKEEIVIHPNEEKISINDNATIAIESRKEKIEVEDANESLVQEDNKKDLKIESLDETVKEEPILDKVEEVNIEEKLKENLIEMSNESLVQEDNKKDSKIESLDETVKEEPILDKVEEVNIEENSKENSIEMQTEKPLEKISEAKEEEVKTNANLSSSTKYPLFNNSIESNINNKVLITSKLESTLPKGITMKEVKEDKPMDLFNRSIYTKESTKNVDGKGKPSTAMTSLQKLKEKIAAQKRLEKELMEREAIKVQEKEKTLQEKFLSLQKIIEDEENFVNLEELEQERERNAYLSKQIQELEGQIDSLQRIVDKVIGLNVDGINVINPTTWELTEEFKNLATDTTNLNNTILEIEEELDALTKSREEYMNKLMQAEESYKALEQLFTQQEQVINDLNMQINYLREQLAKEKVINKEYQTQIERLKSEKIRLERNIKYFKPTDVTYEEGNEGVYGLLMDLERLNEEVKKLLANDDVKKYKEEIAKKDLEIGSLKQQLDELKNRIDKMQEIPYYANPVNLFIPRDYAYAKNAQDSFDVYFNEIKKLREEIEKLKQPQQSQMVEPIAKPQTFTEESKTEQEDRDSEVEVKELQEEVDSKQKRIFELEKLIQEKDQYIETIKKQMQELTEEDIFDPEFKRKIRIVREKKAELEYRGVEEEKLYEELVKKYNSQIQAVKLEIDAIKDKMFELDLHYRQSKDHSLTAKDEYEKNKAKLLVELQLLEAKNDNYNEELSKAKAKYERFKKNKEVELKKLNEEEVNIIQFYMNKMLQDKHMNHVLRSTKEEKESLMRELDELKGENLEETIDLEEIEDDVNDDKIIALETKIKQVELELQDLNKQQNTYQEKYAELKQELNKRLDAENNLKLNDEDIALYAQTRASLEDYQAQHAEISQKVALLQTEIDNTSGYTREELLRKKAEITDLVVKREDLKAKIEFFNNKLNDLEKIENVLTYKRLLSQINQIRKIMKDHHIAIDNLLNEINNKTKELENLKSELKML